MNLLLADITIGVHEITVAIGILSSVTAFLIAFWMRGISADIHDLVGRVSEHAERIAKLETRVDQIEHREESK